MDPAVKTAMGFCVLLGGVCAALLFRHDQPRLTPPETSVEEQLLLRYRADHSPLKRRAANRSGSRPSEVEETSAGAQTATVVTPLDRHESPPALSPEYPETSRRPESDWGAPMARMLPAAASAEKARTHTIVDGDTLAALAHRYLGSSERADDIYRANRDVLRDPKLLPIGLELKLPPRD